MKGIRTFIAIDIDSATRKRIVEFVESLRKHQFDIKWVKPENIHLTIKFLGNILENSYDKLYMGVEKAVENTDIIKLRVHGTGVFPGTKNPRVFWVGVTGEKEKLLSLKQDIEYSLQRAGFPKEVREFSPHITIGRFRTWKKIESLERIITGSGDLFFGEFYVSSVKVYRSELTPVGPEYFPLKEIKFGKAV
jgi:2'-5' RNA ligase